LAWGGLTDNPNPKVNMSKDTVTPTVAGSPVTTPTKPLGEVIQIDQALVQKHLGEVVRSTVQDTLNALLDAEADRLCGAKRYEHSPERVDTRAGHYERQFQTQAGEVTLKMPKLRSLPFETAIIERYKRRETSVEEALLEMYYAGVSMRRVEDITEALWGTRVSPSTVSELTRRWPARSRLGATNRSPASTPTSSSTASG
jgi:transposase-like protein